MNLFELVLWQSCNYKCVDCPMKKWTYEPDAVDEKRTRRNGIANRQLLKWLGKYLDPEEWFIDITGGEPGLYPEIDGLIRRLSDKGYKGLIRTNGSQPLPKSPNFPRIATWHKDREFPKYYDFINILENPDDDWRSKEQFCKDNNIPYATQPYRRYSKPATERTDEKRLAKTPNKLFKKMATMYASGAVSSCFKKGDMGLSLMNMDAPPIFDLEKGCRFCPSLAGVELLLYGVPGFADFCNAKDVERDSSFKSLITYPLLNEKSEWVDREGNVLGVLGDDLDEIKRGMA